MPSYLKLALPHQTLHKCTTHTTALLYTSYTTALHQYAPQTIHHCPLYTAIDTLLHRCTNVQMHKYTSTPNAHNASIHHQRLYCLSQCMQVCKWKLASWAGQHKVKQSERINWFFAILTNLGLFFNIEPTHMKVDTHAKADTWWAGPAISVRRLSACLSRLKIGNYHKFV